MGHLVWQLFPHLGCCEVGTSLQHHIPVTLQLLGLCCCLPPLWRGHFPLLAVGRVCLCWDSPVMQRSWPGCCRTNGMHTWSCSCGI